VAAARADHIREALPDAIRALDSSAARSKLEQLVEFTNR
jgi:anthranilate phosphoribosyltransferase